MVIATVFWCVVVVTLVIVLVAYIQERRVRQEPDLLFDPHEFKKEFNSVYYRLTLLEKDGRVSDSDWDRTYCNMRTAFFKFKAKDMEIAVIHLVRARYTIYLLEKRKSKLLTNG